MPIELEGYLPRLVDARVERYLRIFGAIEIAGTKWCGKTWCALKHAQSVSYVDENLMLATDDPTAMLAGERPHVIDEWQRVPAIWDVVRHDVDKSRSTRGAFILTGSSSPLVKDEAELPQHSGAGRIGRVRMRPMSLFESGDSSGKVSLASLFRGEFEPARTKTDARELVELAARPEREFGGVRFAKIAGHPLTFVDHALGGLHHVVVLIEVFGHVRQRDGAELGRKAAVGEVDAAAGAVVDV